MPEENNIKAVIFDFDGTIADTFALSIDIALKLNDELKLIRSDEVSIEDFRSTDTYDFIKKIGMPKWKLTYYIWKMRILMGNRIGDTKTFDGIPELLSALKKQGIKLAVVSSNSKSNLLTFFNKNNLNMFDVVESPLLILDKSKKISLAVKKLGVKPNESLYVGDETRDILNAHQAGVKAVSVTWGYHFRELLVRFHPDYTIDTPKELLKIVT